MAAKARVLQLRSKIAAGENVFESVEAEKEKKVVMPTFAEFSVEAIEAIANARRWKNEKHHQQWISVKQWPEKTKVLGAGIFACPSDVLAGQRIPCCQNQSHPIWQAKPRSHDKLSGAQKEWLCETLIWRARQRLQLAALLQTSLPRGAPAVLLRQAQAGSCLNYLAIELD